MTTFSRAIEELRRLATLAILTVVVVAALQAAPARAESAATPPRTAAQLEQLVAPIALYPDALLSQVLMASTYPLEVVEAARWARDNSGVSGQGLEDAMQKQSWDPSVKALTSVPQTLQMMNDKLDWTQQLGDAFLAQQKDLLDAVQRLRARADAAGYLKTSDEQKVTRTPAPRPAASAPGQAPGQPAAPAIVYSIEPANPEMYYVPIYDPGAVFGAWLYPDYPPFFWYPPGYVASNVFSFGAGVAVGWAIWGHVDWRRNRVDINVNNFNRFNRTNIANNTWVHNPAHRGGVAYRDANVAARFGDQGKAAAREAFRGKADAGRRDLAKQGKQGAQGKGPQGKGEAGQRDLGKQIKQGTQGKGEAKGKTGDKAKIASQSGAGAKSKSATQGGAKSKTAAQTRKAEAKHTAKAKPHAGGGQAARQRVSTTHQPTMQTVGMGSRAQGVHASGGVGRGGGGMRGGGGRRR
jgi:Protein of unknown function (DUF3300)